MTCRRTEAEAVPTGLAQADQWVGRSRAGLPIGEALRLIRNRAGLTQTAASQRPGAPDFRTLSHWETSKKTPSLRLLASYLASLGLDFHHLQDALDQVLGDELSVQRLDELTGRIEAIEQRLDQLDAMPQEESLSPFR